MAIQVMAGLACDARNERISGGEGGPAKSQTLQATEASASKPLFCLQRDAWYLQQPGGQARETQALARVTSALDPRILNSHSAPSSKRFRLSRLRSACGHRRFFFLNSIFL